MTEAVPVRILVLVVTFKVAPANSPTLRTFLEQANQIELSRCQLLNVIYDNSPTPQSTSLHAFEYVHDPSNRGLFGAYSWAHARAKAEGIDWLLLLDQDSALPSDFLSQLAATIRAHDAERNIAAIVPTVKSGEAVISPHLVKLGHLSSLRKSASVQREEITAINSGVAIRRSFLDEIGGFNPRYWLDFLDYWLFRQIYKRGWVVVVSDSVIEHDLSVRDYRNKISIDRYRNIVKAEATFVSTERPKLETPIYLARLFVRGLKQLVLDPRFSLVTVGAAFWIVRRSLVSERIGTGERSDCS